MVDLPSPVRCLTVGSLRTILAMSRSLGTLLNMATHYSHDNARFTAIAENAAAIAVAPTLLWRVHGLLLVASWRDWILTSRNSRRIAY